MGALCRVKVYYFETPALLKEIRKIDSFPLIGTLLEGSDIFESVLPSRGIIVLGNESRGISENLKAELTIKLTIPSQNNRSESSESLNVASAAAIVMAEFRRRQKDYSK
jgi:TrmH family RNA methyltransferase